MGRWANWVAAVIIAAVSLWAQAPEEPGAAKGKAKGKAAPAETAPAPPPVPQVLRLIRTDTYLVTGHGTNSVFRVTPAGVILVDTKLPTPGDYERLMELIRGVTPQPVKFVINTSAKPESSGNNAKFQSAGADIVSDARTLSVGGAQVTVLIVGEAKLVYFRGEKLLCAGEVSSLDGLNLDWTLMVPASGEPRYRGK